MSFKRGDVVFVDLEPTRGKEQQGERPALIVSDTRFNKLGLAWIAPISQGGQSARHHGFTVSLAGTGLDMQGVVLCHQLRVLDLQDRRATFKETAPDYIVGEVLDKIRAVLE
jgi:mRNA interferase ChpB